MQRKMYVKHHPVFLQLTINIEQVFLNADDIGIPHHVSLSLLILIFPLSMRSDHKTMSLVIVLLCCQ